MSDLLDKLGIFGLSTGVLVVLGVFIYLVNNRVTAFYSEKPSQQQYRQLIMICVVLLALVLAVLLMPIGSEMRGQLLSFLAILLSATIALSSTTLVGNAMAGLMLQWLRNWHVGDYIRIGDQFGRISVMDLLHIEIQTEDRDLTTLPNLYVVTNPVTVLRNSGTILNVEVSLGYDIPRKKVEAALIQAAEHAELDTPFVQIRELGDFSVLYRVSGLLTDIKKLISTRRVLRACVLDCLHGADIEIVSPNFMNTRAMDPRTEVRPDSTIIEKAIDLENGQPRPDDVVFDKAHRAEELQELKREYTELSQKLIEVERSIKEADKTAETEESDDKLRRSLALEKKKLQAAMTRAEKQISGVEAELS